MKTSKPTKQLTDAEIRAVIEETEGQSLKGVAGSAARALLGTLALLLAVFALRDTATVGLGLLGGLLLVGLAAYIRLSGLSTPKGRRIKEHASLGNLPLIESSTQAGADL